MITKTYYDEAIKDTVVFASDVVRAISVEPLDDYKLLVLFSTGERRVFDVKPLIDLPIFAPIRNHSIFKTASVGFGTVVWFDGDIDISPESLYEKSYAYE